MRGDDTPRREPSPATRLETGVQGLDLVLAGGLLARRTYVLKGPTGAGKTVLAAQLCFERARRGAHCAFITLLAETNALLIENLSSLEFFDPSVVAKDVMFVSGLQAFETGGLKGLLEFVRSTVQQLRAELVILDGLAGLCYVADSPLEMRRFMRDLAVSCSLLGCTAVGTMPNDGSPAAHLAQAESVADGIIELTRLSSGMRSTRTLEVVKFRGSHDLPGRHAFEITTAGVVVHPRMEVRLRHPRIGDAPRQRRAFGIDELDEMLRGGIVGPSTTVLAGAPGSGKTLLGMQFLAEGAQRGEPGLHVGFYESPPRLVAKADAVGIPAGTMAQRGLLELLCQPALDEPIDALGERVLEAVRQRGVQRLFIDGIDGFELAAAVPERLTRFFVALASELRARNVTTLVSEETDVRGDPRPRPPRGLAGVFENVLLVRTVELRGQLHRLLSIVKIWESDYDATIRELTITPRGIRLAAAWHGDEDDPGEPDRSPRRRPP